MTDRSYEIPQDNDLRSLERVVSACTLGLWSFAVGLLIGTFCVFVIEGALPRCCRTANDLGTPTPEEGLTKPFF